jgi:hypothetical protein
MTMVRLLRPTLPTSPVTTSRIQALRVVAMVGFGTALLASCGVDQSGLGSMQFLPHDAAAGGTSGTAGTGGNPAGAGGTGGGGGIAATGVGGLGGNDVTGSGMAGSGPGGAGGVTAGTSGTAGANGAAGTSGAAGTTPTAGTSGTAGAIGTAGTTGSAGTTGAAGTTGTAGTTGAGGTIGVAGANGGAGTGGMAGTGGGGATAGSGGIGVGGRGGIGLGGRGGSTPCTATSCSDGCCKDSFTCIRMRSALQCGAQGATCMPCGGCQTCSSTGQCRIDPMSRWTITAVSAELSGTGWDRAFGEIGGTAPDPFCEFENPAGQVTPTTAGTTDTITDNAKPVWNQVITPAGMTVSAATLMATNPTWQIWVGDDDGCTGVCTADVACTIRQQISESTLRSGELVVTNRQSCAQLTLDFTCTP